MAKTGRPPFIVTDEIIKKAESLAANGLTMQEVCDCLDISHQTLSVKRKEYPEFAEAIRRGKSKGIGMMANNLVKLAKGGNAAANIFFLKARAHWYDDSALRDMFERVKILENRNKKEQDQTID
jgi:hypothetical protein